MLHSQRTANMNLNKVATKTINNQGQRRSFPLPRKLNYSMILLSQTVITVLQTWWDGQYEQNGQKLTFCLGSLWLGNKNIVNKKICFKAVWLVHSSTNKVQWNIFCEINLLHSTVNCTAYLSLYIGLNMDMYHAQICWYSAFTVNEEYSHSIQFMCPYHDNII
jgi:hypothetical protein